MNSSAFNFWPRKKLLVPTDRTANRPLNAWAYDLLVNLDESKLTLQHWAARGSGLAVIFNQAALINFHLGRLDIANELCYRQLTWLSEAFSVDRDVNFLAWAFQPWLNLCRLDRAAGRMTLSTAKLTRAFGIGCGPLNPLGTLPVSLPEWDAVRELHPTYETNVIRICFRELLVNHLETRNYLAALSLLMEPTLATTIATISVLDALPLVLCLLHAPSHALEILRNDQNHKESWQTVLLAARYLESLLMLGMSSDVELLLGTLIETVPGKLHESPIPSEVDLHYHLALLFEQTGRPESSRLLASECFEAYSRLEDELGSFHAARLAYSTASVSGAKAEWSAVLEKISLNSCYNQIRTDRHSDRLALRHFDIRSIENLNLILLNKR